jgi:anti-anti-sigma factor
VLEPLQVLVLWRGRTAVARLRGELDLSTAPLLTEELAPVEELAEAVVVDAAHLEFVDLAGLDALRASRDRAVGAGAGWRLRAPSRPLARLLALTGEPLAEEGAPAPEPAED